MKQGPRSPIAIFLLVALPLAALIALAEYSSQRMLEQSRDEGGVDAAAAPAARVLNAYLRGRHHVTSRWLLYGSLAFFGPPLLYLGLRRLAAGAHAWRERVSGMQFRRESYGLAHPFAREADPIAATQAAFVAALDGVPDDRVVVGFDGRGDPVTLSDHQRSMHVHLLGQTGSGKTQSVIYPMLFQDARRGRPIVFLDAKGSADNEDTLAAIAAATGRLGQLRQFSLNPGRPGHTYNPLHLVGDADPRAAAERCFSTFSPDLDNPYYRDMARELFVNLVCALAATGKRMCLRDVAACIADVDILMHGLSLSSDRRAVAAIRNRVATLGDRYDQTYSGLLAAVNRYDHPAVNAYAPDIVLEDLVLTDDGGASGMTMVGFSLPANAYKFLARAVGLIVLQHIQQLGAERQMDRSRSQQPVSVFADEFYTFAYDGMIDAVNKLRDAHISLLLSHQSLSDLTRVSPEFSRGILDNTRTKIVLYQNDAELCEWLAASVGTRRDVELTVRRSVDGYLNQASTLEASSREVDQFVLHPSKLKALSVGQAYLVRADGMVAPVGVNLPLLPALRAARPPALGEGAEDGSGLGLWKLFEGARG